MLKKSGILLSSSNLHSLHPSGTTQRTSKTSSTTRQTRQYAMISGGHSTHNHGNLRWPEMTSANAIPTPYQIFSQKKGSPYSKQRFYELVKQYHPDRHDPDNSHDVLSYATKLERYRLVVAANDILSDPVKRSAYDLWGAGWNNQPEVVRDPSSATWDRKGWGGGPRAPHANATWEDWERYYQRDSEGPQEPRYVSNSAFVGLIVILAALGGIGQATRVGNYSMNFLEQRDALHDNISKDLKRRRKETTTAFSSREERIQSFLRQRDPMSYGGMDPREDYRKLLPAPEICSSGNITSDSVGVHQQKITVKVASLKRLALFVTPLLVLIAGLLVGLFRYSIFSLTTPDLFDPAGDKMGGGDGYRSVAYFVNWAIYGRKFTPQMLPADKLTHVLYAFANVKPDSGEVYLTDGWADTDIHFDGDSWNDVGTNLYGCLKQLNILKQKNRSLRVMLSIGGWTYSSNFAAPASTENGRTNFASTAVELIKNLGFDGLDIDWEYPKSRTEAEHFVLLLKACREAMDAYSATLSHKHHFELSVACPAGPQNYNNMDIGGMDRYLDFWNLMAYDYAGSWDSNAGHQANLNPSRKCPSATPFNTHQAVDHYKRQGVQVSKIVLGMPLYGRAFESTEGLGKPFSGVGEGSWEQGVFDYKALPLPNAEEKYDEEARATYSYDAAKKHLVTYDTVEMAREKAAWIKKHGLGGAMWWESSADKAGEQSLIRNVVEELGTLERTHNCIEYPHSKYENLRKGFTS